MDIKYNLTLRNNGIVNDLAPLPCSDEDSKDIAYIRKIFDFIESNPDKFDAKRVYAEGFSQNSMFSAYIGFCFPDNVVGIWQGTVESRFKKARFKKESRFMKDCCYNRFFST